MNNAYQYTIDQLTELFQELLNEYKIQLFENLCDNLNLQTVKSYADNRGINLRTAYNRTKYYSIVPIQDKVFIIDNPEEQKRISILKKW